VAEVAPDELRTAVNDLLDRSDLKQVRLSRLHVDVADAIPDEVTVDVGLSGVNAAGADSEDGEFAEILVSFTHAARMRSTDGEDVASIEFTHTAHIAYEGERPTDQVMETWVMGNVIFMVYPYVRQTLQQACMQVGIPPIVLGYLKRDELVPRTITVVVNKTQLAPNNGEPLPEEALEA
jgi:hypothetical protein